jgi:hypothetical protein
MDLNLRISKIHITFSFNDFFNISSEARKQYDAYCLSNMQTIHYALDRTHFQGPG